MNTFMIAVRRKFTGTIRPAGTKMTISEKRRGALRFERKKQQKGKRRSGESLMPRMPGQVEGEGIDMGEISYLTYE